jgi:hypothetical protein
MRKSSRKWAALQLVDRQREFAFYASLDRQRWRGSRLRVRALKKGGRGQHHCDREHTHRRVLQSTATTTLLALIRA